MSAQDGFFSFDIEAGLSLEWLETVMAEAGIPWQRQAAVLRELDFIENFGIRLALHRDCMRPN